MKAKQNSEEYEQKLDQLKQLIALYKSNFIDLFFADESSFNLQGYIPYGWQPRNEYISIAPSKTSSENIFGLMSLDNRGEFYSYKGSGTSAKIIAFLEDFCASIEHPTVAVIDNAPIHHSEAFEKKVEEWKEKNLYIFFLPKYSPHLNPIEILWRKIKYEWLKPKDYDLPLSLKNAVLNIFKNYGKLFNINFSKNFLFKS